MTKILNAIYNINEKINKQSKMDRLFISSQRKLKILAWWMAVVAAHYCMVGWRISTRLQKSSGSVRPAHEGRSRSHIAYSLFVAGSFRSGTPACLWRPYARMCHQKQCLVDSPSFFHPRSSRLLLADVSFPADHRSNIQLWWWHSYRYIGLTFFLPRIYHHVSSKSTSLLHVSSAHATSVCSFVARGSRNWSCRSRTRPVPVTCRTFPWEGTFGSVSGVGTCTTTASVGWTHGSVLALTVSNPVWTCW